MTSRSDAVKDFEEFFNDVSNNKVKDTNQTEEYGDSTSSEESFDDMLGKVSNDLEECESGHSLVDVDKALEAAKVEEVKEEAKEDAKQESKEEVAEMNDDDIFDALPEEPKSEPKSEPEPEPEIKKEEVVIPNPGVADAVEHKDGVVALIDGKVKWNLESPTAIYNKFYDRKKELIEVYTGEQLNFYALNHELLNAYVDISHATFDQELVLEQMQEIQQHRERLKNISLKCNVQYFVWKRWIEKDMMKGYLAMIQYIKPAIKQEGLVLEHMRDLEYYYAQLEALYNNCGKVEKTLEAAYDTLSRRVSICMELKVSERYDRSDRDKNYSDNTSTREVVAENKSDNDFDEIEEGEVAKKEGDGFCEWI